MSESTEDLKVALVSDLPWPHTPFRCKHFERFAPVEPLGAGDWEASESARFAEFHASLASDEIAACKYHSIDWATAARVAVEIYRSAPADENHFEILTRIEHAAASFEIFEAASSFFAHPLILRPGARSLDNGQHRTCALKSMGATEVLIARY